MDRNVDFAVMAFEPVDSDLESFPVLTDELVLIMHPGHPLSKRDSVNVSELGKESFLAHNVKTGSRFKVMETFAQHHTPLNITLELATVETIKRFVQLKIGLAFVPRMCVADELERGTLVTIPVPDLTYARTLWVTHRSAMTFSTPLRRFSKSCASTPTKWYLRQIKPWTLSLGRIQPKRRNSQAKKQFRLGSRVTAQLRAIQH